MENAIYLRRTNLSYDKETILYVGGSIEDKAKIDAGTIKIRSNKILKYKKLQVSLGL